MSQPVLIQQQAGFALINAIFLLVVLAFLGVVMVTLSGVQSRTPLFALQGARAYHAASSGIEWGSAKATSGSCAASTTFPVNNFDVTVTCSSSPAIVEGTMTYHVYRLRALASSGTYGTIDYISRRVQVRVVGP